MCDTRESRQKGNWPKLALMPLPAKALLTMVVVTMAIALMGALGQIIVHDIIPTFFAEKKTVVHSGHDMGSSTVPEFGEAMSERGDLFATESLDKESAEPFYQVEQFVWTLKWTHIHLFGMNMIFIFTGAITLFLDLSGRTRAWLIVLPFVGVLIDIASVWLKGYVSPAFFWLHLPGGVLFTAVFVFVSLRALWEMWWLPSVG
jgi:hypothetical protein